MAKMDKLINPEMELRILSELEPLVGSAYEEHMSTGPRKNTSDENQIAGTINPLEELYKAARLEPQEIITPELIDIVHTSFSEHVSRLKQQGVDILPPIRRAGQMNLGTENGQIWYHGEQYKRYHEHPAFVETLSRWSAEEADHGPFIELWGMLSGSLSPDEAHKIKIALLMGGIEVETRSMPAINAFTDPQEFDTGDAHKFLGSITDVIGRRVMNKLAGHEYRHGELFRDLGEGVYSLDQDIIEYVLPIEAEVHRRFKMPASRSFPSFTDAATEIAMYGLFTNEGVLQRQKERVEALGLLDLDVKTDAAIKAQEEIEAAIDPNSRTNIYKQNKVDQATEKYIFKEKEAGRVPFILGRTIIVEQGEINVVPEAA